MTEPKSGNGGFLEFAKHEKGTTNGVTPIGVSHDAKAPLLGAVPSKADSRPLTAPVKPTPVLSLDARKPTKQ